MNLTLSRRGDYAIRAALYLADAWDPDGLVRTKDICRAMRIPSSYAPRVMGFLLRAGVLTVRTGRGGGYRLTRDPEDVTLLEVVQAAEGDLAPRRCPLRGVPCHVGERCALHPSLSAGLEALQRSLAETRLADVTPRHALGKRRPAHC